MKVPFIDYTRTYNSLKEEINAAIFNCLNNGDLIFRNELKRFEEDFSDYCGVKHGIGTGSCTGALFLALKALGIGLLDEVITVSHTYVATIDSIVHAGATPVLVDVEYNSMNMDPKEVEKAITPKTKAIIPVHLNGLMCDMDSLMEIAMKHNLYLIEDAAQSPGVDYNGNRAGSCSDIACFSFYPAKVLGGYFEGGMAVTNNDELASKLYLLRDHGEWPSYLEAGEKGEIYGWGYNSILDNIAASVLNVKLKYLPEFIEKRRYIANRYFDGLNEIKDIILPFSNVYQNYVIRTEKRNELKEYLTEHGVETLVSWETPNHKQKGLVELNHFNLPVTERISNEVLSLPMYEGLTEKEIDYVIETIRSYFS